MKPEITALLPAFNAGDARARDQIVSHLYATMHELAAAQLRAEYGPRTLSATELVNECFLRLFGAARLPEIVDRQHMLGLAARTMRHVLIDAARQRQARWRQGLAQPVTLTRISEELPIDEQPEALDQALDTLERLDPRQARIVELRFFVGLSQEETAQALDVSLRTVQREWRIAKAWLLRELDSAD